MGYIDCDVSECVHNNGNHECDRDEIDLQFVMYTWDEPLVACANYEERKED